MAYDPMRHHRRSIRLAEYDYRQNGAYYVTLCTHERECLFGEIDGDGTMRLNEYGEIGLACWEAIPDHFPQADVDAFVVMPNHVHGILTIAGQEDTSRGMACHARTPEGPARTPEGPARTPEGPARSAFAQPVAGSLATIVGAFKGAISRRINVLSGTAGWAVWHRNYYERIIRNDEMLNKARCYIVDNPVRWAEDVNNPNNVGPP